MDFDQNCDCKNCAIAERDYLRAAAKEAAEHLRNEAAELKKAHTVSGEWDRTEPDAMDECERLIALANRLQTNAQVHGLATVPCNGGLEQSINQQTTP